MDKRALTFFWNRACAVCRFLFVGHVILALLVSRTMSRSIVKTSGLMSPSSSSVPVSSHSVTDYLTKYGYLVPQDPKTGALRSEEYVKKAIKAFQRMAGINETGEVDAATQAMMRMPRCGNSDNIALGKGARRKRYALQGSKWGKTNLTYKISIYPGDLPRGEVDDEIGRALRVWGEVTPLKFIHTSSGDSDGADVDVRFVRRSHGDGNPFDGRGRTLAHAFFPQWGGDAHFDEEEAWTIEKSSGVNLFQVAAHEFGHSLGLSHSDTSSALMAPFYRGYQRYFRLDDDDIRAIQELYGRPHKEGHTTVGPRRKFTKGPRVNFPPICRNPKVDGIVMNADGKTYVFQGSEYYRLNEAGLDEGYPRSISKDWDITGPIDCALHWDNGYTFIFKGDHYWKFYNLNLIYRRKISEGFKGVPNDLDAAFVWGGNGKTYFIKDNQYWRYTENKVDRGYPRSLSVWSGLPSHIDAAVKWKNGRTYFFSGDRYYRYNDVEFNIDSDYPRKVSEWWFGCPEKKSSNLMHGGHLDDVNIDPLQRVTHDNQQYLEGDQATTLRSGSLESAGNHAASVVRQSNRGLALFLVIAAVIGQLVLHR